ncbi:unnamed protein product, partial [Candidula unifasciata]
MIRRPRRPPMGPMGPPGLGPLHPRVPPPLHLGPPRGPPGMGMPPLPVIPPPMPVPMVSSCTNSNDPTSKDSRLFVGNLNTLLLTKEDVERIFAPYGFIYGISMHKGYAFVQFSHPDEARRAGASEDGQMYAGQAVDINIVSQPKNRKALKRSAVTTAVKEAPVKKTRSGETPVTNQSLQRTLVTLIESTEKVAKSAYENKLIFYPQVSEKSATGAQPSAGDAKKSGAKSNVPVSKPAAVKTNWPDVLICGVCKMQFTSLHSLAQHKKVPCQLHVSTQAKDESSEGDSGEPTSLQCAICEAEFNSAWALCVHCTQEHDMAIYKVE